MPCCVNSKVTKQNIAKHSKSQQNLQKQAYILKINQVKIRKTQKNNSYLFVDILQAVNLRK